MATFIAIVDYTDQGIRSIKESPARAQRFAEQAQKLGASVKDVYWTHGGHDGLLIFEAPDDEVAAALMLSLTRAGNVRTQTLRAYGATEMQGILDRTS